MSNNDRIQAAREKVTEQLYKHLGFYGFDGTYIYVLTRVKEAFAVGTMTLDDFVEIDDEFVGELADLFMELINPLLSEYDRLQSRNETLKEALQEVIKVGKEDKEKSDDWAQKVTEEARKHLSNVNTMKEALEWYGDSQHYMWNWPDTDAELDRGERARTALSHLKG